MGAGMKAIERATAHFEALGTRKLEVPEWCDESGPLIVYWLPMTLAEAQRAAASPKGDKAIYDTLVDLIVMKALDADGERLFTIEDKHALRTKADASVVSRIATAMMERPSPEETEKN